MTGDVCEMTDATVMEDGSHPPSTPSALAVSTHIQMMTGNELAGALGYEGVTGSFRRFCQEAGIKPLPGRRDCYDPTAVRHRLNIIQGIGVNRPVGQTALEQSKERRRA